MDENRKFILTGGIGILIIISIVTIIGEKTSAFYWGITIGIIFGIVTCIYLSKAWDPYLLEPTNQKTKKTTWKIVWVVPFGIIISEIMSNFPEGSTLQYVSEIYNGAVASTIFIALNYILIQVWRYRPK